MGLFRRLIILSAIFTLAAVLTLRLKVDSGNGNDSLLLQKELTITRWEERGIPTPYAVLDTLQADVTFFADYFRSDDTEPVNLYMGIYNNLEKAKMSHAPQVCYIAQGWVIVTNDTVPINLNGKPVIVNRLILEKGDSKSLVYYWYQLGPAVYKDLYKMKLSIILDRIMDSKSIQEKNAFVRISTLANVDMKQAHLLLQTFADDAFDVIVNAVSQ